MILFLHIFLSFSLTPSPLPTELISDITLLDSQKKEEKQALCLAGTGIQNLQKKAAKAGLSSHSVLGSLFLNPTVAAGVAFGSGSCCCCCGVSGNDGYGGYDGYDGYDGCDGYDGRNCLSFWSFIFC